MKVWLFLILAGLVAMSVDGQTQCAENTTDTLGNTTCTTVNGTDGAAEDATTDETTDNVDDSTQGSDTTEGVSNGDTTGDTTALVSCYACRGNISTCGDENWVKDESDTKTCVGSGDFCWARLYKANATQEDWYIRDCDDGCCDTLQEEMCSQAAGQRDVCERCCKTDNCNHFKLTGSAGITLACSIITWSLAALTIIVN